jgi:hypothetical protein
VSVLDRRHERVAVGGMVGQKTFGHGQDAGRQQTGSRARLIRLDCSTLEGGEHVERLDISLIGLRRGSDERREQRGPEGCQRAAGSEKSNS